MASVVVVPDIVNAGIGGTTQLIAKAYDAGQNELSDRTMVWTTSNAAVATVDGNGLVTAKAKGTATITATTEGKSGTSQFTISPGAVNKVTVTPDAISMKVGDQQHLAATARDASGTVLADRTAIWSSDNTQVVTVSGGDVIAVGRGSAKITATVDGVSGSASVTVANAPVAERHGRTGEHRRRREGATHRDDQGHAGSRRHRPRRDVEAAAQQQPIREHQCEHRRGHWPQGGLGYRDRDERGKERVGHRDGDERARRERLGGRGERRRRIEGQARRDRQGHARRGWSRIAS